MYLNTYGQSIHICKIVYMSNPCDTFSCPFGLVYGLEIACGTPFFLTINRQLICSDEKLTIDSTAYYVNDVVELGKELLINGCDTIIYSYPVFDIKGMKKLSLTNRDIQHFLGTYSITAMCEAYYAPSPFPETRTVVIENGIDSDLLIHFSNLGTVRAFVTNDNSFIIPRQIWKWNFYYQEEFLHGKGVLKNDSICLSYVYGTMASVPPYNDMGIFGCDNCNQSTSIVLLPANPNKVYYNTINQTIIIDDALQNQSLTLVLYDIQGKILLREINVCNSINIAHLPQGVYVYRLLQGNQVIYRGKVLK